MAMMNLATYAEALLGGGRIFAPIDVKEKQLLYCLMFLRKCFASAKLPVNNSVNPSGKFFRG